MPGQSLRVMLITDEYPPPWSGGGTTVAAFHHKLLISSGCQVTVVTTGMCEPSESTHKNVWRILTPPIIWRGLEQSDLRRVAESDFSRLSECIRSVKPNVILTLHMWGIAASSIAKLRGLKIPIVSRFGDEWYRLHYLEPADPAKHGWCSECRPPLDIATYIVNSDQLDEKIRSLTPHSKIITQKNPIDPALFSYSPSSNNIGTLLFAGRAVPHKGLHLLLEALSLMRDLDRSECPILRIAAIPSKLEYLRQLHNNIQDQELVELIEWIAPTAHYNIPQIIAKSDAIVLPSPARGARHTIEGCPNVIVEAWAIGRPVISSRDGHGGLIENGINGLLVDVNCPESWNSAIQRLRAEPDFVRRLVRNGHREIANNHNYSRYSSFLYRLLKSESCSLHGRKTSRFWLADMKARNRSNSKS